jgi:hypothetical protein
MASNVVREGDLITVGGKVRIQTGARRLRDVATLELLHNDVTAGHYLPPEERPLLDAAGRPVVDGSGKAKTFMFHYKDSVGKPIVLGQEMDYLDWLNPHGWYLYEESDVAVVDAAGAQVVENGQPVMERKWLPVQFVETSEADAVAAAQDRL